MTSHIKMHSCILLIIILRFAFISSLSRAAPKGCLWLDKNITLLLFSWQGVIQTVLNYKALWRWMLDLFQNQTRFISNRSIQECFGKMECCVFRVARKLGKLFSPSQCSELINDTCSGNQQDWDWCGKDSGWLMIKWLPLSCWHIDHKESSVGEKNNEMTQAVRKIPPTINCPQGWNVAKVTSSVESRYKSGKRSEGNVKN